VSKAPQRSYAEIVRVKELSEAGYTRPKIQEMTGVPPDTQKHWKKRGWFGVGSNGKGAPGNSTNDLEPEREPRPAAYKWPEFRSELLAALFGSNAVPNVVLQLELARRLGNTRVHRFTNGLVDALAQASDLPQPWLAAIAGFPIVAEDIHAPAFEDLAKVILEYEPYRGSRERRAYHKAARPVLRQVWFEAMAWSVDFGYMLMPKRMGPVHRFNSLAEATSYKRTPEEIEATDRDVEDSLLKGRVTLYRSHGGKLPLEKTTPSLLLEIVSRLPDLDKQKGKVLQGNPPLLMVLLDWCATIQGDGSRSR
jgi:hypothetical protein